MRLSKLPIKVYLDRNAEKHKARLEMKGYAQHYGADYFGIFSLIEEFEYYSLLIFTWSGKLITLILSQNL